MNNALLKPDFSIKNNQCKVIKILLLTLFLFGVSLEGYSEGIDKLVIKFLSWEPLSSHSISCIEFDGYPFMQYEVEDSVDINQLFSLLKSARITNDTTFDVGCKLLFLSNNKIVHSSCLNKHFMLYDGYMYKNNKKIVKQITKLIHKGRQIKYIVNRLNIHSIGEQYDGGFDKLIYILNNHISKKTEELNYKGTMILIAYCHINRDGRTIKVVIKKTDGKAPINKENIIIQDLKSFLSNKILWKPNKERMQNDVFFIPLVITKK